MPEEQISNIGPKIVDNAIEGIGNLIDEFIGDDDSSYEPRPYEVGSLNPNHTLERNISTKQGDVNINNYLFDDNNIYANNNSGVEIDGFLFFPESIKADESYARREFKRTKIMSGGEFVTRGQYIPKEFSFSTTLDIDPNQPNMYDKIFQMMENKQCEVISPYMGDIFKAEVQIDKTHPKASPSTIKLDIKVKEIVEPKTTIVGDSPIDYPSTTSLSDHAISVKVTPKKDEKELEREQITNDLKVHDNSGEVFDNPYD